MYTTKVIISYTQNNQSSLNPMFHSIPSHNSLPSGLESALSWDPAERDSVLQTRQSCGLWQASPASCVILSNVGAPFAVAGTIPLALLVPMVRTTAKLLMPPPLDLKKVLWELRDTEGPEVLSTLTAECVKHLHMGTTLSDSTDRREAFFIPFPAHCGFDASGFLTLVRRAKEDCPKGPVSPHVGSTQWIWGCWAAQETQGRS